MGALTAFSCYLRASWLILAFYISHIFRFGEIHPGIPSGALLSEIMELPRPGAPKDIPLRTGFARAFNDAYAKLRAELRATLARCGADRVPYATLARRSFAVRLAWAALIAVVVAGPATPARVRLALLALGGAAQCAAAPLSAAVCVLRLGTNAPDAALHYACAAAASAGVAALGVGGVATLTIGPTFLAAFLAADLALSAFVYWRASEAFGAARLLKHAAYGTLNTKTYFLVVFGVLRGCEARRRDSCAERIGRAPAFMSQPWPGCSFPRIVER